jgi:hypothetical protein
MATTAAAAITSEDDYGFSGYSNGNHQQQFGRPSQRQTQQQQQHQHLDPQQATADKWYLKDSMRPVGAAVHGGNCKCYRCQRKLTTI